MVQQREVDDLARLQSELTVKQLREATKIANKWKRLLPTVRNWARRYCKRAATGVLVERVVTKWVYADDDSDYNTKAMAKWEYIDRDYSFKYHEGRITTDLTPACEVAFGVRRLVDPYTKAVALWQDERAATQAATQAEDCKDNSATDEDEYTSDILQDQSPGVKRESVIVSGVGELDDLDGCNSDKNSDSTSEDELQNDWGLQ